MVQQPLETIHPQFEGFHQTALKPNLLRHISDQIQWISDQIQSPAECLQLQIMQVPSALEWCAFPFLSLRRKARQIGPRQGTLADSLSA
jgi:hypothetical protein